MIRSLSIRGYMGFRQVRKEEKSILNKANILYKIAGMRVNGPFGKLRRVFLDEERGSAG